MRAHSHSGLSNIASIVRMEYPCGEEPAQCLAACGVECGDTSAQTFRRYVVAQSGERVERIVGDGRVVILFGYADYVFACRVYAETAYDAQTEQPQIGVRVCEQRLEGYGGAGRGAAGPISALCRMA